MIYPSTGVTLKQTFIYLLDINYTGQCPSSPSQVQMYQNPMTVSIGHCLVKPQANMRQEGHHPQIFSLLDPPNKISMEKKKGP